MQTLVCNACAFQIVACNNIIIMIVIIHTYYYSNHNVQMYTSKWIDVLDPP